RALRPSARLRRLRRGSRPAGVADEEADPQHATLARHRAPDTRTLGRDARDFAAPKSGQPVQPRRGTKTRENLGRLGEQWSGVNVAAVPNEPLAVLELRDSQVERERKLAKALRGLLEQPLGLRLVAVSDRQLRSEPGGLRLKGLRRAAGREPVDDCQEVTRFHEVSELQARLQAYDERLLDRFARDSE